MSLSVLDGQPGVDPGAPIARANPVAKLAVSLLISLALLLSVDVVSALVALALELLALPWCGLSVRRCGGAGGSCSPARSRPGWRPRRSATLRLRSPRGWRSRCG